VDLGMSPLCQTHIASDQLNQREIFYPLRVRFCEKCFLVQLDEYVTPAEIFTEYAYFSSYADTWVRHARAYTDLMIDRFALGPQSFVVELASNDGYLLQHFVQRGVPVLGVEPAANVARAAVAKGIRTEVAFFGAATASRLVDTYGRADLLLGNNVLAHVPNLNDFLSGMKTMLAPSGVITMEFPHLLRLMQENQFDTIYHEHFSYFWFSTAELAFRGHGIVLFDVEELPTHGGSLRIYGRHAEDASKPVTDRVLALKNVERQVGYDTLDCYASFDEQVKRTKRKILACLIGLRDAGKSIVGYGAPGKGNTLLNYCGIREDLLDYTVDRSPFKQGKFTPGTRIPIHAPERIRETKPDYVFILPWNLKHEIMEQNAFVREWGGRFIVPIPEPRTYD
jgi:hypothetical protein